MSYPKIMVYITPRDAQRYLRQFGAERDIETGLPKFLADIPGMTVVTDPNSLRTREYYRGKDGRLAQSVDSELLYFVAHNLDLE